MTVPATRPILELDEVSKRFDGTVTANNLSLAINSGEFFTFLGPSGSGKSTILRMIAGLERPDGGRIVIEGKDMIDVPPWRRNLGMVFQHYAVFPHMTIAQNLAYGLRVRRLASAEVDRRVEAMLRLVGLQGMEKKNATLLSGGEQQRVALARALILRPSLLLLDEPLSALDEKIRREMQGELKSIHRETGTAFVYVTHDQEEALTMSDRIAVLNRGVCVQCDEPETLFRRPRTRFVASFFRGCNVLRAELAGLEAGHTRVRLIREPVALAADQRAQLRAGGAVNIAVRAECLHLGERAGGCRLKLPATLREVIYRGTNVDHLIAFGDGQQALATSTRREVDDGQHTLRVGIDPEDIVLLED